MVGFFDAKNDEMVKVTTRTGAGIRTRLVLKSEIEAEQRGEEIKPKKKGIEIRPLKEWTKPEKFLGVVATALTLAAVYHGALYLAGTGFFPTEVNYFILNAHHQILEATGFADNMVHTFEALKNGELDVDGALSGAAKIGETAIDGTNRKAINPLLQEFSKIFEPLNLGK